MKRHTHDDDEALCPNCSGSGEGMADGTRCRVCKGSGAAQVENEEEEDCDDKGDDE
jgi:DnaJ-class molecular chaperone